jgi:hypothetical protein
MGENAARAVAWRHGSHYVQPRLKANSGRTQRCLDRSYQGPKTVVAERDCKTGTPERFASIKAALSYCGLTSALRESAGQQKRGPLSKQRNRHLQSRAFLAKQGERVAA